MVALSPASLRLLVVEHDPGVGDLLHVFLASEGYDVQVVASPQEALAHLNEHTYHLILTDVFKTAEREPFHLIDPLRDLAYPTPVAVMTGWHVEADETAVMR